MKFIAQIPASMAQSDMVFLFLLLILIMALGFLYIGFYGLFKKRPLIFNSKIGAGLVTLGFLPLLISQVRLVVSNPNIGLVGLMVFMIAFLVIWFAFKGYIIFGITDELVQEAVFKTLDNLGIKYESSLSAIKLQEVGYLQVEVQSWVGTCMIKPKNKGVARALGRIVPELRKELSQSQKPMNFIVYWIYTVTGALLMLFFGFGILSLKL